MAHHGSLSDTLRRDIEEKLKAGELPALVGTSSLELGIDIGSIDLVVQLQSPKTVTQGLQRVGRAGHSVGETSYGKIYGTHPEDLIEAAVVARGMQERRVEAVEVPRNSLDVLAQQIVAAVAVQDWPMRELYRVIKGAYPYGELTYPNFEGVVKLVSGHYPRELVFDVESPDSLGRDAGCAAAVAGNADDGDQQWWRDCGSWIVPGRASGSKDASRGVGRGVCVRVGRGRCLHVGQSGVACCQDRR